MLSSLSIQVRSNPEGQEHVRALSFPVGRFFELAFPHFA